MRFTTVFLLAACVSGPALAKCYEGSDEVLRPEGFRVGPEAEATFEVEVDLQSRLKRPTRMIDGYINFTDRLGETFASYKIERDAQIPLSGIYTQHYEFGAALDIARLLKLDAEDVSLSACVKSVLYEDGTKEEFN